jgi:hypothetical protein
MLQQYNRNKVDYMGLSLFTVTTIGSANVTEDSTETLNGLNTFNLTLPANSSITFQYKYDLNIQSHFSKYGFAMKNLSGLSSLSCQMSIQKKRVGGSVDTSTNTFSFSNPSGTWTTPSYCGYQELYKYNTVSFIVTISNNTASTITAKIGDIYLEC